MYQALELSTWRGNSIRQQLREQELIVEVETRLGKGNRPALLLVATMAGFDVVNRPLRSGRGGAAHRHFQEVMARHALSLGYQANKEHRLETGGSVDVHLSREGVTIAVEIAIHSRPQRELKNIRKCLDAGYTQVLALFLDPKLLEQTRSLFAQKATAEEQQRVAFMELQNLDQMLK